MAKSADAFRTISEAAEELEIPKHVLRFWEAKFTHIKPMKRGGGRRYYRPEDMDLLKGILHLLHREGYTIKGVQKILRVQGVDAVKVHGRPDMPEAPAAAEPVPGSQVLGSQVLGNQALGNQVSGRGEAAATAPAATGNRRAGGRTAAGRTMGGSGGVAATRGASSRRQTIDSLIAELEACRRLLTGEARIADGAGRRRAGTAA